MNIPNEKFIIIFIFCAVAVYVFEVNYSVDGRDDFSDQIIEDEDVLSGRGSGSHDNWHVMPNTGNPPKLQKNDLIYNFDRNTVPIVNEEYKLIFFLVAKSASSEWLRFFMRLKGLDTWCGPDPHDHTQNGLTYLSDFSIEDAQDMMTSPVWTRAIFVRNPKPRILSAFLDKAVSHSKSFQENTCKSYGTNGGSYDECVDRHEDFDFFLREITTTLDKNVHWRSIYSRVDEKWWPWMNYIANMEDLSEDAEHFLKSIYSKVDRTSAWDRIGKTGWSDDERDCSNKGTNAFLAKKDTKHKTNARDKMKQYYNPRLEQFVEEHYADDLNNPYFRFSKLVLFDDDETSS
mmetsp:Transcript_2418/g.3616  ORF Transcript_2418/g.3616 Transcript_2418/m.3616 type:complete len:345 (-) Transcript_2418:77-1111(-)|eukprot:CAMPEP_0194080962 /NCGR_PEP_ID=MMETSP0149-20130528/6870_1 /TAXON_ID=122233 /ORGANISM="Chaetoceros debilis, Strain MM31A-1" /LENGTH=344 /DNA_ID=CAMNT_0038762799 /DNA_START=65 /DNA_END=1099 /DNA_ORIENTATION=+